MTPAMSETNVETISEVESVGDAESEVYEEEEECGTDNEEEVDHDMVECSKCKTLTHYSIGCCSNCNQIFKMSKAGYLISGEDGNFICDDDEEVEDGDSDSSSETVLDIESDVESDVESEDDCESVVIDEEEEYVYKKSDELEPDPKYRRITRSAAVALAAMI